MASYYEQNRETVKQASKMRARALRAWRIANDPEFAAKMAHRDRMQSDPVYAKEIKRKRKNEQRRRRLERWKLENGDKWLAHQEKRRQMKARRNAHKPKKPKIPPEEAERRRKIRHWLGQARRRARDKNLPFDLKPSDISVPSHCPVLGIPLFTGKGGGYNPNSPSLDRINSKRGYTRDNVCIISMRANVLKGDATLDELQKIMIYIELNT